MFSSLKSLLSLIFIFLGVLINKSILILGCHFKTLNTWDYKCLFLLGKKWSCQCCQILKSEGNNAFLYPSMQQNVGNKNSAGCFLWIHYRNTKTCRFQDCITIFSILLSSQEAEVSWMFLSFFSPTFFDASLEKYLLKMILLTEM